MRLIARFTLLLFVLLGAACATPGSSATPTTTQIIGTTNAPAETGLAIGNIAPEFTTTLLDGTVQTLNALRGKVVVINFWATWCGPCRFEMPYFQTLVDKYMKRGFVVLAVNNREIAAKMGPFLDEYKLRFPVGLDVSAKINALYEVRQYPTSYVIGRDGRILARQFGPFPDGAVEAALETWLK